MAKQIRLVFFSSQLGLIFVIMLINWKKVFAIDQKTFVKINRFREESWTEVEEKNVRQKNITDPILLASVDITPLHFQCLGA